MARARLRGSWASGAYRKLGVPHEGKSAGGAPEEKVTREERRFAFGQTPFPFLSLFWPFRGMGRKGGKRGMGRKGGKRGMEAWRELPYPRELLYPPAASFAAYMTSTVICFMPLSRANLSVFRLIFPRTNPGIRVSSDMPSVDQASS